MLTVYAFSADNWRRPETEVRALMRLLRSYLIHETDRCIEQGVRLRFIGRRDRLAETLVSAIEVAEARTRHCCALTLRIAVDYSSRDALVEAAKAMAENGRFDRESMGEALGADDLTAVLGVSLLFGAIYIVTNALVDVLQGLSDPRVGVR